MTPTNTLLPENTFSTEDHSLWYREINKRNENDWMMDCPRISDVPVNGVGYPKNIDKIKQKQKRKRKMERGGGGGGSKKSKMNERNEERLSANCTETRRQRRKRRKAAIFSGTHRKQDRQTVKETRTLLTRARTWTSKHRTSTKPGQASRNAQLRIFLGGS